MTTGTATRAPRSLDQVRVEEVMHRGVISCTLETPLRTVARMMAVRGVHCVVGLGDAAAGDTTLWGIVSDLDVVAAAAHDDVDGCEAGSCVSTDVASISPDSTVQEAARLMSTHGVSHL